MSHQAILHGLCHQVTLQGVHRVAHSFILFLSLTACTTSGAQPTYDIVDSSTSFQGWRNEVAVFRTEAIDGSGNFHTTFEGMHPSAGGVALETDGNNLTEGLALVRYGTTVESAPFDLQLDVWISSADRRRIDRAVSSWPERRDVPSVPATLTLSAGKVGTIWRTETFLQPRIGETTLEWQEPMIENASLSPTGKTVVLQLEGVVEYPVLLLQIP